MYATEDLMLEFLCEVKEATLLQLDQKFSNSDSAQLHSIAMSLTQQNFAELKHERGENQRFVLTQLGEKEYRERQNRKKADEREGWVKRNWLLADALKVLAGGIIGWFIRSGTEPKYSREQSRTQFYQQLPKSPDTLQKKSIGYFR